MILLPVTLYLVVILAAASRWRYYHHRPENRQ